MKPELFGALDLIVGASWAAIIIGVAFIFYLHNSHKAHYKWFFPNLLFHLLFGVLFALAYAVIISEGGDTLAYHDSAYHLTELFWKNPPAYFQEIFTTPSAETITDRFDADTGYPPSWIYREPESFLVAKVISFFSLITFNSYLGLTLICAAFASLASWRLFVTLRSLTFCPNWVIVLSTMFIPTVAFWCSGISKDTLVLGAFYIVFSNVYQLFTDKRRISLKSGVVIFIYGYLLYHLRGYMLIALAVPVFSALIIRWAKKINDNPVLLNVYRFLLFGLVLMSLAFSFQGDGAAVIESNDVFQEVIIIQQDFAQNKTYDGYRYDLGIDDYSLFGMIRATPLAIITAFYRPFLWEANSAFLLISGLESLLLLVLTVKFFFFSGSLKKQLSFVFSQEFLTFAILFTLLLGFFVGFTSGLFNVLVRFKAPILVFIITLFASSYKFDIKTNENQ